MTERRVWQGTDLETCEVQAIGPGQVAAFTCRSPGKETVNEDVVACWSADPGSVVLVVADGMGGAAVGERASAAAVEALLTAMEESVGRGRALRDAVLDGFERAGAAVQELPGGARTTLVAVTVEGSAARTYHVGDSGVLVTGQRGRLRLLTTAHSPTGYAVEAGLMDEEEALGHDERHLVSNVVGDPSMTLEVSSPLNLAPRDTLVLATDGLFDNLTSQEIQDLVRTGPLAAVGRRLVTSCRERMAVEEEEEGTGASGKPDDLGLLVYRPRTVRKAATSSARD